MLLETKRLIVRQWKEADKDSFFQLNSDPVVMEYFPNLPTREQSDSFVDKTIELINKNGFGFFAVEEKSSGEFMGFVGIHQVDYQTPFTPCVEIGWRLHKKFWRQGYATEAAFVVLHFAFGELRMEEIVSFTAIDNKPSESLMKKIGMSRDMLGDFDHPKVEDGHKLQKHLLYRLNRDDFFIAQKKHKQ